MRYELPSLFPRNSKPQAVYHVVESSFQKHKQVGARDTFRLLGHREPPLELVFAEAVHSLHLLFLTEANTILRHLSPRLHVDARGIVPLLHPALLRVALLPFLEELHAFSSAYLADRSCVSRQFLLLDSSSFWRPA